MTRPFYTVPSPRVLREEVRHILEAHKSGDAKTVAILKNLSAFSDSSPRRILHSRVSKSQVQQALALEYEAADWSDLTYLAETMEHDDFLQIGNRAKFLRKDHAAQHPTASVRLRKALPGLRRKSDRQVFGTSISLADAQRTIAKEYGFEEWPQLRKFVRSNRSTDGFLNTPGAMPPDVAELVAAIDFGDVDTVSQLIRKNPSLVHARVASDITCGDTLLHRADPRATNGSRMKPEHLKIAQLLIDNGIDINAMGGCGDSCFTPPVDASSWIGNRKMVELLLANGADPDRSYWSMTPPVETAANHNGKAIFRMLAKAGADYTLYETISLGFSKLTRQLLDEEPEAVNSPCRDAMPLVLAADYANISKLLLRRGANPNIRDRRGVTPLMAAIQGGNKQVIELLQEHGAEQDVFSAIGTRDRKAVTQMIKEDPSCHKSKHITPLIWAVRSGDRPIVQMLLRAGANPNERQDRWMENSPLVAATAHQQDHLVPLLIDAGAKINSLHAGRWSLPLTSAVRWGTYESVRVLLEAGANPSFMKNGFSIESPMGWTSFVGDALGTKMMLDSGVSRTVRGLALISAAHHGKIAVIELLGTLDTRVDHPHLDGSAIQRATARRHTECVELLSELIEIHKLPKRKREDILKPRAEFLHLLFSNDGAALDKLLSERPDLVDRDIVRGELFHHATANLQQKPDKKPLRSVVKTLVKHGVPWTIHSAVACGPISAVKRLLNQPEALKQALHAAAKFNKVKVIQLILDAGANVNAKESWGTALHEAVRYQSLNAAEYLLDSGADVNATDQYGTTPRAIRRSGNRKQEAMCDLLDAHGARV